MYIDVWSIFSSNLVLIVGILIGVAFLTLLERKILGYIHARKGPNKVGPLGMFQPFGDAIKLFSKEQSWPFMGNIIIFYMSPIVSLFLSLLIWMCTPFFTVNLNFNLSVLFFLSVSSLSVYGLVLAGWSSNSNYAMLGSLRGVAQTISYEVSMVIILLSFLFLILSFNLINFMVFQEYLWFMFFMFPLSMMWIVSALAETNRSPFDFAEGESELVSGFNVEYSSGGFAFLFLAEYSNILFMSMVSGLLFLGGNLPNASFFLKITLMSFIWIWIRGTFPRYRYDKLMHLAWKSYLCVSLNLLIFFMGVMLFNIAFI